MLQGIIQKEYASAELDVGRLAAQPRRSAFPAEFDSSLACAVDDRTRALLLESAPLMAKWSRTECARKPHGGMEEWAKQHAVAGVGTCSWYHGTWQFLRLLNMVATPPWYPFYMRALGQILAAKPKANVLISAAADWGMVAMLSDAAFAVGASPEITLYDICCTPLLASEWYASRHGFTMRCVRDNILESPDMPFGTYDLIVTDEFLTVLKDEDKPLATRRWKELLKPGGAVVTTAMIGGPTEPVLRAGFAARAKDLLRASEDLSRSRHADAGDLVESFTRFADVHTRHMLTRSDQLQELFADFRLFTSIVATPGECVNPTSSYQIVAIKSS